MPKIEIDGRTIEVEEGVNIIQAADRLGVEIPHYCWHPGLTVAGNCRMCLVEIEKSPKLQIACNTRVSDGMVVHTKSEKTVAAQKAVLEFLLINHPIDCPICDQAGECKLQEYYMDYDRQESRVPLSGKVRKGKAIPLGPHVMLDQERCILCSRCVRFLDEITGTHELAFYNRGDHNELALAPGKTLDNPYSANVADICPVGALTNRDFRFRARVWYLERADSLCAGCANGCNIELYHREGRIFRYMPRFNPDVNQYWICDAGRMTAYQLQGEGRLLRPLVRGDDEFAPADWSAALTGVADRLQAASREHGPGAVGMVVSAEAPNEEIHLLRGIAGGLGATLVGVSWSPPDAYRDDLLIKADKNPNTRGLVLQGVTIESSALDALLAAAAAGSLQALVLCRADLTQWRDAHAVRAALERVPYLVVLDAARREVVEYASVVLPIATHAEMDGTFTNHADRVQRFHRAIDLPGEVRGGWSVLGDLAARVTGRPPARDAEGVFAALAAEGGAFRGLSYTHLGGAGAVASAAG
jgi:NADH-quinone oxidoreductase subunit G